MNMSWRPPPGWDERVSAPCQRVGFADAMRTMGYRPLFLWGDTGAALGLVRGWFPGLRRFTARANLFAPDGNPAFVWDALGTLGALGIPYVKVGDTMWGVPWSETTGGERFPRTTVVRRHTLVLDLLQDDAALLRQMDGAERKIRKAEREGVTVSEVRSEDELRAYCQLSRETSARVRARSAYTDFPDHFFHGIYRELVPAGAARFYLGWHQGVPLAGCLFLCSREQMLYFLGGSSRDRELTAVQAPSAVFWHAIREAKRQGMVRFDFGGCTPTEDVTDPRYGVYAFKKRWGGRLETFYNLEVVLGRMGYFLQERILSPLWDRAHPAYFRLVQAVKTR